MTTDRPHKIYFKKLNSKNESKIGNFETNTRPFDFLIKLFTRNQSIKVKKNERIICSNKSSNTSTMKQFKDLDICGNLELVLMYTKNLMRQKVEDINRKNLIQQIFHCSQFISAHLKESQNFIRNLNFNLTDVQIFEESLKEFKTTHEQFANWIEGVVQSNDTFDLVLCNDLFCNMNINAGIFITKLKSMLNDYNDEWKRSSIDNSSLFPRKFKGLDWDKYWRRAMNSSIISGEVFSSEISSVDEPVSASSSDNCFNNEFSPSNTDPKTYSNTLPNDDVLGYTAWTFPFHKTLDTKSLTSLPITADNFYKERSLPSRTIDDPSNTNEGANFQLPMTKNAPVFVADPSDRLNVPDMQDDIEIITRSFDVFNIDGKNSSSGNETSSQKKFPIEPNSKKENVSLENHTSDRESFSNSEVKSDTEEYFEYFEIDGVKYRQKMTKRTVVEKIKVRKTILVPMKQDGSGPEFFQENDENYQNLLESNIVDNNKKDSLPTIEKPVGIAKSRFRRGNENRFRVSKSMFYPYKDQMKRLTYCHSPNTKSESNNKLFPLMKKYMYRFGESNFEEPVIDKRFSTQLTNSVCSHWYQTSESNLPQEKSRSICYLKECTEMNENGQTIHNALQVTASRTVRMKVTDSENEQSQLHLSYLNSSINTEEERSIIDEDDSDISISATDTSLFGTDSRNNQFDSLLISSEEETDDEKKEIEEYEETPLKMNLCSSEPKGKENCNKSFLEDIDINELCLSGSLEYIINPSHNSVDSSFYSRSSNISETKDKYTFILKESNATPYLIFDEESKYGECDIAGGPIDALIVYACDGKHHLLFLGAFLDTYRTFIEPEDLIYRLIVRYKHFRSKIGLNDFTHIKQDEKHGGCDNDPEKKCKHVLSLLSTVIGKLKGDLTQCVNDQIEQFKEYLTEIKEIPWVETITRAVNTQKSSMNKDEEIVQRVQLLSNQVGTHPEIKFLSREFSSPSKIMTGTNSTKLTILSFSSREIAEQMTLLDWIKYRDVELTDILNLKDIENCNLPGVIAYAKHFDNVQYWTQSILLDPERLPDRDKGCCKFFRIMKHLQKLNNFSSFNAILLAIQLLPVKKMFSRRVRSKIKEYENYMKPPRFEGYKADLKEAVSPCIPFLGIFFQDIVRLNIANPPFLDLQEVMKNVDKSDFSFNSNQLLMNSVLNCGPIINFWRSFKQYIFLKNCNKDQDTVRYSIKENEKVLQFLNNFKDSFDECTVQKLIKQVV